MIRVKICGITRPEDARLAVAAGADALGFVFHPGSPRCVAPEAVRDMVRGLPPFVLAVGVFVDETPDRMNELAAFCGLDRIQLHGSEPQAVADSLSRPVIKAVRVRDRESLETLDRFRCRAFLLDTHDPEAPGGTGKAFDWRLAAEAVARGHRVILAGGLTPENVAQAVRQVRPYGVDVSSGVEQEPGRKDPEKVRAFIRAAKYG